MGKRVRCEWGMKTVAYVSFFVFSLSLPLPPALLSLSRSSSVLHILFLTLSFPHFYLLQKKKDL